ncbi:MAG: bifunctional nicotinamidase/pyrazinamidase [Thermoanaerobaculia bacterium]|nr:bifunctional nicotinamidase/pyrazinamidase [Thermoanaerobaculia bacterium]
MSRALLLVDIQNDFIPGGSLAVPGGDLVVPVANAMRAKFDLVVATQDWHPANHGSFASNHPGTMPGDLGELGGLPQIYWPDHCVQGTRGAWFHAGLDLHGVTLFRKGTDPEIDSYSALFDNGHRKATGLGEFLRARGVRETVVLGLATDYCVKFTVLDARGLGFDVTVVEDGCRGVELVPGDSARAFEAMRDAGAKVVQSGEL